MLAQQLFEKVSFQGLARFGLYLFRFEHRVCLIVYISMSTQYHTDILHHIKALRIYFRLTYSPGSYDNQEKK